MKVLALVSGAILGALGVMIAATAYYHHGRFDACRRELEVAVVAKKTYHDFLADPRPDGLARGPSSDGTVAFREFAAQWTRDANTLAEIEAKASRASRSAAFLFGDMVYILHFDDTEHLSGFECLSN